MTERVSWGKEGCYTCEYFCFNELSFMAVNFFYIKSADTTLALILPPSIIGLIERKTKNLNPGIFTTNEVCLDSSQTCRSLINYIRFNFHRR